MKDEVVPKKKEEKFLEEFEKNTDMVIAKYKPLTKPNNGYIIQVSIDTLEGRG